MNADTAAKLLSASVRPLACFALVGAFIYAVVAGLPIETTAAIAGPMGLVLGWYFRERARATPDR